MDKYDVRISRLARSRDPLCSCTFDLMILLPQMFESPPDMIQYSTNHIDKHHSGLGCIRHFEEEVN